MSGKKRLWAVACLVGRNPSENRVNVNMVEASSEAEALGLGLLIARKLYPESDGFSGHRIYVSDQVVTPETVGWPGGAKPWEVKG